MKIIQLSFEKSIDRCIDFSLIEIMQNIIRIKPFDWHLSDSVDFDIKTPGRYFITIRITLSLRIDCVP